MWFRIYLCIYLIKYSLKPLNVYFITLLSYLRIVLIPIQNNSKCQTWIKSITCEKKGSPLPIYIIRRCNPYHNWLISISSSKKQEILPILNTSVFTCFINTIVWYFIGCIYLTKGGRLFLYIFYNLLHLKYQGWLDPFRPELHREWYRLQIYLVHTMFLCNLVRETKHSVNEYKPLGKRQDVLGNSPIL